MIITLRVGCRLLLDLERIAGETFERAGYTVVRFTEMHDLGIVGHGRM